MQQSPQPQSTKKTGNYRANCKRCPTWTATHGHGSTQCIPCQQRGLYGLRVPDSSHISEPNIIIKDIGKALIDDIKDTSHHIDMIAMIRILPPHLAAPITLQSVAGMTIREIGKQLHIAHPTVMLRLQQASVIIKELM